jgi:hypothetical protein
MAGCEVGFANKHGNEHTVIAVLRQLIVQAGGNIAGFTPLLGHSAEKEDGLCHKE